MDTERGAGHVALDLVGTLRERETRSRELLDTPAELGEWLVAAGLLDSAPCTGTDDLRAVHALRERVHELLCAAMRGEPLPGDAREAVNALALGTPVVLDLSPDGELRRTGGVAEALVSIARAAVELLGGADRARVRWCAGDGCTRPFLDRSRAGRRRWCGMAGCGDRAKARAYRARQRDG